MSTSRAGDAGLSLIEVIVSLAIFALIGVAGLSVLNSVARTGERTEGRLEHLAQIERTFLVVRRDLLQVTPDAMELSDDALSFRRADGERSLGLTYRLDGATLHRRVDRTDGDPIDQHLLANIASVQWRLLDRARQWHDIWPPGTDQDTARPLAAELSLDIHDPASGRAQRVTRLMVLPAGQGR